MKIIALYRDESDHARTMITYVEDFRRRTGHEIEHVEVDSRRGSELVEIYSLMQYPALLALDDEGKLLKAWQGDMPLMNELSFYTISA